MKRSSSQPYLMVFAALLLLLSIPKGSSERLRGLTVASLAPAWEQLNKTKLRLLTLAWTSTTPATDAAQPSPTPTLSSNEELQYFQLQTLLLSQENDNLREILEHQPFLNTQKPLEEHQDAIPARVIFRTPSSWNSSLWINVGESDNAFFDAPRILKNCPVVVGSSLVGVIDYVGNHQSRVRLITDSGLTPAVRAARGKPQLRTLEEHSQHLLEGLSNGRHQGNLLDPKELKQLMSLLEKLQRNLKDKNQASWYLAKGEIQGSSKPLWRTQGRLLKGVGFNYDFPDDAGPARDLRTGKPLDNTRPLPTLPLLKVNDILVTTGMDGMFPPGLNVAVITKIAQLREGDYTYELEATPTAGNLDDLSLVFVIPPLGYDPVNQPPVIGR